MTFSLWMVFPAIEKLKMRMQRHGFRWSRFWTRDFGTHPCWRYSGFQPTLKSSAFSHWSISWAGALLCSSPLPGAGERSRLRLLSWKPQLQGGAGGLRKELLTLEFSKPCKNKCLQDQKKHPGTELWHHLRLFEGWISVSHLAPHHKSICT